MTHTLNIQRPAKHLPEGLAAIGSATCSAELSRMGIRNAHITGPVAWAPDKSIAGPALVLDSITASALGLTLICNVLN
jgi:hypothetical protein